MESQPVQLCLELVAVAAELADLEQPGRGAAMAETMELVEVAVAALR